MDEKQSVRNGIEWHEWPNGIRQRTFFTPGNYRAYLELLAEWCGRCGVVVWAYCLMPNHVHLIAVPDAETVRQLRRHEETGRPAGSPRFVRRLERLLGRVLQPRRPGRPRKEPKK